MSSQYSSPNPSTTLPKRVVSEVKHSVRSWTIGDISTDTKERYISEDRCLHNKHLSKCFRCPNDGSHCVVHWDTGSLTASIRQEISIFTFHTYFREEKNTTSNCLKQKYFVKLWIKKKSFHFIFVKRCSHLCPVKIFFTEIESTCFSKNRNIISYLPGPGRGLGVEGEEDIYGHGVIKGVVRSRGVRRVCTCWITVDRRTCFSKSSDLI